MFRILLIALLLFSPTLLAKQVFGTGADPKKVIPISKLMASPEKYLKKEVTVEGVIDDVCAKRGCWMKLMSDKKFQSLRIKVRDGVMVFPMTAKGKKAIAKGQFISFKLNKHQTIQYKKHIAEEQGKKFDPKTVKGPMTLYQLNATGAVILK